MEIYVHIPFCVKKCGYCDFVSGPAGEKVQRAYMEALRREICLAAKEGRVGKFKQSAGRVEKRRQGDFWKNETESPVDERMTSVFFGGGTPSIVAAEEIAETLACIRREFVLAVDAEITLEANPGTLTREKLACYREAGINRLSIGLQSAEDGELVLLGRIHTFSEFQESYRLAREAGFENINVDLMAALPGQTIESFEKSLLAVKELSPGPEHLSVYSLIIEEGTPFYEQYHKQAQARASGEENCAPLPSEEEERAMYALTGQILGASGYRRYEISNYAKPGFSCKHNVGYWTGVPYLGFGISSASYMGGKRYANLPDLERYLEILSDQGAGSREGLEKGRDLETFLEKIRGEEEVVNEKRAMEEFLFLGLRMMRGVSEEEFERRFGKKMEAVYGTVLAVMERDGLMERTVSGGQRERRWHLTARGIDVSNYVLAEFLL